MSTPAAAPRLLLLTAAGLALALAPAARAGDACPGPCAHTLAGLPTEFAQTIIEHEPFPGARFAMARRLADNLASTNACFAPGLTDEQRLALIQTGGFGPAAEPWQQPTADQIANGTIAPFYFTASTVYRDGGAGNNWSLTTSGGANRIRLTYSFPADGATWGTNSDRWTTGANNLNATITTAFGATQLDRGREWLRQGLAGWRRIAAIDYDEVADNNTPMNTSSFAQYGPGDIRIGGYPYGFIGVLAYNQFPTSGSDMAINTSYSVFSPSNNYRYTRNLVGHEHGHGLGAIHPVPCDNTKLMEPLIITNVDTVQLDDIRFAQRNYGDRFAGNRSAALARDFGNLTTPVLRSVTERDLSTNGRTTFNANGNPTNNTGVDWFRFTLSSPQTVSFIVQPRGGSYLNDQQDGASADICAGVNGSSPPTVVATEAGDLAFNLYQSDGTTLIAPSVGGGPGVTETLTVNLSAGTYTLRVWDSAASNPGANQIVQIYDMLIRVGAAKSPPQVIAGLNKRVQANTNCQFVGNALTRTTETGATINSVTGYAWDLDGDGVTNITTTQPSFTYVSNGTYPVTLRVTDSNGMVGSDTINVTVFGATTTVTGNTPAAGNTGQTIPITLTGTNFKLVTAASQVTVPGGGVTVTGTPVSNALGTQLTGLSLVIAPGAALGSRTITVTNTAANGGPGSGGSFQINAGVTCPTITQNPPASVVGYVGQPVTLTAAANPAGVTFQWRKDTVDIPGATAATFTIPAADFPDAGSYDLVATNACGSATSTATTVTIACAADYNADGFQNLDDLGDFITDFYANPPIPGGIQPDAPTYPGQPLGYGQPCPAAGDALPPYAADAYRAFGFRVGYSADGSYACPADALTPFPNLDNLGDFITAFYTAPVGTCP